MLTYVVAVAVVFLLLERIFPDQKLPDASFWSLRALIFNAAQFGVIVLGAYTWDHYLQSWSVFSLQKLISEPLWLGLVGYLISTFIYYWWHRFRHMSDILWRVFHQLHHSPVRLEVITAFYKHPLELIANSILSGAITYTLLGLSLEAAAWLTFFSAVGEFVYHMNIGTPRWMGFFIQRPEMHRIHHEMGVHHHNYGDLPIWDMLFRTYKNPPRYDGPCGFKNERELQVLPMLLLQDVNPKKVDDVAV